MKKYQSLLRVLLLVIVTMPVLAGPGYPPAYRELGLPEYGNATVTDTGRDNTSLRDGIKVTLLTRDDGTKLRAYYETEMQSRGWQLQETAASAKMRAAGMLDRLPFGAVFKKDRMRFQVFTNPKGNGVAVHISVIED